jgi:MFS family permease
VGAFRALWFAQLGSLLGTWMQTVGAQWVLVAEPGSTALVALVQVAAMLPMLLFALPAGALADIMDRRRLLIGVQLFQMVVGSSLSVLTALDLMPPALLLTFTFLLGACLASTLPAYQVVVQEFVPREQVRMVAALGGVAVNGARAVGPALAGVLLAQVGAAVVFAVPAVSALAFVVVLVVTRRPPVLTELPPERFATPIAPRPPRRAPRPASPPVTPPLETHPGRSRGGQRGRSSPRAPRPRGRTRPPRHRQRRER